jgi:hypothetical protein
MALRADYDPKFYRRFWFMGVIAFGFALWSLYDGMIGYPHQRERALALQELMEQKRLDDWDELTQERGWARSTAGLDTPKTEGEIIVQYVMAAIAGAIGLLLVSLPLRARGRWIESTEEGINSSWGQSFRFDQVQELNKRQWRSKGIAKVTYLDGARKRKFVIDDYKFDRYPTDAILYELEQHIDPQQITGGPPEPPSEATTDEPVDADAEQPTS